MMVVIYILVFWLVDHVVLTNNQKMEAEGSSKCWYPFVGLLNFIIQNIILGEEAYKIFF
jgi:hypothetical protein